MAIFEKNKSWIRDSNHLKEKMKFQKLMFDLYECFARKFNNEINKIKNDKDKSHSDIVKIEDKIYKELQIMEDSIMVSNN